MTGLHRLDLVGIHDPAFRPAILAWAARASGLCLACGSELGIPVAVAFLRSMSGEVAMGGGVCRDCADFERGDLERAVLAAFGFPAARVIDPASLPDGGRA